MTIRIIHNISTTLEWTEINYWGGGDLNRIDGYITLALCSDVDHKHNSYSVPALALMGGRKDECPHQVTFRGKRDVLFPPCHFLHRKSCWSQGNLVKKLIFGSCVTDD